MIGPLLTSRVHETLRAAQRDGAASVECSLDLERTRTTVGLAANGWEWRGAHYPWLDECRERTIYHWNGTSFEPVSRYTSSFIKLVPTEWGPPTFEIDGIKMLPTSRSSPYADAAQKVALIEPRGKAILDTCGGLGYFAAWCLEGRAARVLSFGSVLLALSDAVINNDGVRYIEAAKLFARGEFSEGVATYSMPLYPLLILLAQAVVPNWVLAARLVSLVSLVLVLIPLHLLTRDLFDRRAAFWACLGFALAPLPNRWTIFVIREPLFALLFLWAVHLTQRALRSQQAIHLLAAAAVSCCTNLVRLEGVLLFPVYFLMLAGLAVVRSSKRKVVFRNLLIWTAVPACLVALGMWIGGTDELRVTRSTFQTLNPQGESSERQISCERPETAAPSRGR